MRPILVTGFGDFPGVSDNPSARLARLVDGKTVAGIPVVGLVLPVQWEAGPELAIAHARAIDARLVLGIGVATNRAGLTVERWGYPERQAFVDAAGALAAPTTGGQVACTLDVDRLAAALGATISEDPGRYVCNAWIHLVVPALQVPAGFLHLPASGLEPEPLLAALEALVAG
jgi:pyroglutamyl-peptidase